MTYTTLKNDFLYNIGLPGETDSDLISFFDRHLGSRYQDALAMFQNWMTTKQQTASTVADQQYYHYPPGVINIESATVTVGSISYPLETVHSQLQWDRINELLISTSAIPVFIFPRRDDFGIYPIPQDAYTITFNYTYRDRNLSNADYTTGTVTATSGSQTITGSGTTFTADMVGRWFKVDDDGYWYRISGFSSTTSITLESFFEGTTGSSLSYTIGESPELPEEAHILLSYGVTADYFAGPQKDTETATWWDNKFWTGDGKNNDRTGRNVKGGLIGLAERYASRSNHKLIYSKPFRRLANDKVWATTLSSS